MARAPDPHLPGRNAAYWLLASGVLVLPPLLPSLPVWLLFALTLLIGWRYLMLREGWPVPGRWVRAGLTVALAATLYAHYGTLFGREPGSALLATMLALKFLELRRLRDYMLSVFLIYFLTLVGFLHSQSPWLGAYLLVVVIVSTATLVRLAMPDSRGPQAMRLAGGLTVKALPLMLAMYLLFPRVEGPLWGLPRDAHSGLTGLSDQMRPGAIHHLSESEEIAFRVKFHGPLPAPAQLYWRVLVFWDTDGRVWQRGSMPGAAPAPRAGAQSVRYTVTLEPWGKSWLPALDLPGAPPPGLVLGPGHVLEAPDAVAARRRYAAVSYLRYDTGALGALERERALRLPAATGERVVALAQAWRSGARDPETIVRAGLGYFREQEFVYTLQPPLLGADPVDEFLFETRRGFCEHYASAFATLMRAAGIPSRVVAGYQGGEFNPTGDYMIVRQSDAHAWVEVWLAGRGWVRVDPTAAVAPERIEYGAFALERLARQGALFGHLPAEALRLALARGWFEGAQHRGRLLWDAVHMSWAQWVLGYGHERQRRLLQGLGLALASPLALVVLLAGVLGVLLGVYWLTDRSRAPSDPAKRLYERYCRRLARVGLAREPNEGPLAFAHRCGDARPDLAGSIAAVTESYLDARYSGRHDAGALRALRRLVNGFRAARSR